MQHTGIVKVYTLYFLGIISLIIGFYTYFSYNFLANTPYVDDAPYISIGLILLSPILFKLAIDIGSKKTQLSSNAPSVVVQSSNAFIMIAIGAIVGILLLFLALVALVAFSGSGNF